MSISVNGQSQVPPGFRFHPTEEELLHYYLKKKVSSQKIDLDVIPDVDLNKLEPWDIQEKCRIGSTRQDDWYFFSYKDKKYPTGMRTNRATASGFWKATGRDKPIYGSSRRIGMRKTLVFYTGRAPRGRKSEWIMHEYRLDNGGLVASGSINDEAKNVRNPNTEDGAMLDEAGWVVCRVFRKKNHVGHKTPADSTSWLAGPTSSPCGDETLEEIIRSTNDFVDKRFLILPSLLESQTTCHQPQLLLTENEDEGGNRDDSMEPIAKCDDGSGVVRDWAALDRLVAAHLNCQLAYNNNSKNGLKQVESTGFAHEINAESSEINFCISNINHEEDDDGDDQNEMSDDLIWSFEGNSYDHLCHLP